MASKQVPSNVFLVLGIVFLTFSITMPQSRAVWLAVGVVFLVVGLARRRAKAAGN